MKHGGRIEGGGKLDEIKESSQQFPPSREIGRGQELRNPFHMLQERKHFSINTQHTTDLKHLKTLLDSRYEMRFTFRIES